MNPYRQGNPLLTGIQAAQAVAGIQNANRDKQVDELNLQLLEGRVGDEKKARERQGKLQDLQRQASRAISRFDALSDPDRNDAIINFGMSAQEGDIDGMEQNMPSVIEAMNEMDRDEIKANLGEKVPGTEDVIIDKSLKDLEKTKDGKTARVLTVTARKPNGETYEYEAPRTTNAKADDDEVYTTTDEEDMQFLGGAVETAHAIRSGEATRDQVYDHFRRELIAEGMSPADADAFLNRPKPVGGFEFEEFDGKPVAFQRYSDGTFKIIDGLTKYKDPDEKRRIEAQIQASQAATESSRASTEATRSRQRMTEDEYAREGRLREKKADLRLAENTPEMIRRPGAVGIAQDAYLREGGDLSSGTKQKIIYDVPRNEFGAQSGAKRPVGIEVSRPDGTVEYVPYEGAAAEAENTAPTTSRNPRYEEGKIYQDANGNKAVYRNGAFVEVE